MENKKYNSIDGLRTIGAIGIVAMHIRAVTEINIDNYFYNNIIPFFNYAVFLFMVISGFGMCCGYYDKIKNNKISMNEFFEKRYKKILPFFFVLVIINLLVDRSLSSLIEGFADLTLFFAFLPNPQMSVIGVGWTLGVIFAFYIIFPFYVFLLDNKKRAWFSFTFSLIYSILCKNYFFSDKFVISSYDFRINLVYCLIYFIIGGLIFLYKDDIVKIANKHGRLFKFLIVFISLIYFIFHYFINFNQLFTIEMSLIFGSWLIYAISFEGKLLSNRFTKFISNISMEIYLCHFFVYRIIEKMGLVTILKNNFNSIFSYIFIFTLTFLGAILFSIIVKNFINKIQDKYISER